MDDPVLLGAVIAAISAVVAGAVAAVVQLVSGNRQRENELVVNAFSNLGGGSQKRTAGIATLKAVLGPARRLGMRRRSRYDDAVSSEFEAQLIYVLTNGKRRWAAHEVANMIAMGSWLFDVRRASPVGARRDILVAAMETYLSAPTGEEHVDPAAVRRLRHELRGWLTRLGVDPTAQDPLPPT
ncbi:hypothetical protein ACH3VR_12935 [Microbacterium sp. B2969]|uniref:DUF4760 domain-containing protein n=1 Tax=Microbacterium alkaliflavum TaxID=3248839 RepID=A0ABW7Q8T3_9MICO